MRLCIDGIGASKLKGTNLFSYTTELLSSVNESNDFSQIFALWDIFPLDNHFINFHNVNFIPLKIDRISSNYEELIKFLKESDIDIYHSPNNGFSIPKEKCCKYVCTIHSLYPINHKEDIDTKYYNKFCTILPQSLENCDKIIAVSNFTKSELISEYNISDDKIVIIPPKCGNIFKSIDTNLSLDFLAKNYNITRPFIFYCGSITKRKMIDKILLLLSEINKKNKNIDLVLAGSYTGKRNEYYKKLKDYINKNNLQDNVRFLGYVNYYDLPAFYNAAICTIDFSSYNDFPMSIIEAINSSSFVICNKTPTNTTLLNNAVVYTNFDDFNIASDIIISVYDNYEIKNKIVSMLSKPVIPDDIDMYAFYKNL